MVILLYIFLLSRLSVVELAFVDYIGLLMEELDVNNDSLVDRPELEKWLYAKHRESHKNRADETFAEGDLNHDNALIWEEVVFLEATNLQAFNDDTALIKDILDNHDKYDKASFSAADKNHNEELDHLEFFSFLYPEDDPSMYELLVNNTLQQLDKDNDGLISFKEYKQGVELHVRDHQVNRQTNDFYVTYDQDGDTYLNRDEILMWRLHMVDLQNVINEGVEETFAEADKDQNDILTPYEIKSNYDLFLDLKSQHKNYNHDEF